MRDYTQSILLPHGRKQVVTVTLGWSAAVAEAVYPLHRDQFRPTAKAEPLDYATAVQKAPRQLHDQTAARLLEYLHRSYGVGLAHLAATAAKSSQTATLDISRAMLSRDNKQIAQMTAHFGHRPKGQRHDHRLAFVA